MIGFMGWMKFLTGSIYFDFTVMNTSMPIILLTIANSDGVHIVSRFFREIRKEPNQNKALQATMRRKLWEYIIHIKPKKANDHLKDKRNKWIANDVLVIEKF